MTRATYRAKTLILWKFKLRVYLNKEDVDEARGFAFV